ncbi:MAG TPA: FecR domain-containing protein [Pedobacter sp.]|uniref:FecR family protein n=1 Tax=Pedobacter sp. TaxID=1411316 RepID=UPI002BC2F7C9|nr:FecR domain-containing protein [Pedobacter sp.]HMI02465.1 FecR domain-containing protein [Pedobacter sp.]
MKRKKKTPQDPLEKAIGNYFETAEQYTGRIDNPLQDIPFEKQMVYTKITSAISRKRKRLVYRNRMAIAASVTFFLCAALYFYLPGFKKQRVNDELAFIERKAPRGSVIKFALTDGTIVFLNAESKLTFPGKFTSDRREVKLEGEGYFQVAHDVSKPFIVRTGTLNTQVLGTSFNINAYPQNKNISVTVMTGKVGVYQKDRTDGNSANMILPNQQLLFDRASQDFSFNKSVDADDFISWSEGRLSYKNGLLADVVVEIGRKYNVDIELSPGLKNIRINADFDNLSLDQVLTILSRLIDGETEYRNGAYFLKGRVRH